MILRASCVLLVALVSAAASSAQTSTQFTSLPTSSSQSARPFLANESHIQSEMFGTLYANSAFAHGYRHGYEEGFHVGDLDVHMGREPRLTMKGKDYLQAIRQYRPAFGSKALFEDGFHAGLRSGYADAISGSEFRASQWAMTAVTGLTEILPNTRRINFDEDFAAGYKSAQSQNAPAAHITAEYVEQYCRRAINDLYSIEFCSGYSRGYVAGITPILPRMIARAQADGR